MERKTKYANYNYEKEDEQLVNELDNYLEDNALKIYDFFKIKVQDKIVDINIIPTKEEYDEIAKRIRGVDSIPKWSIGFSHDDKIEYLSLRDYKSTSHAFDDSRYDEMLDYYKKTIVHEYVHYVAALHINGKGLDRPARYLNEGIAIYLSGQKDNQNLSFDYSLEDIEAKNNTYDAWYIITKHILEEYGKDYFFKLFNDRDLALKELPNIYEEVKESYSKKR